MAYARLDMAAIDAGLLYLGGAGALYDLPPAEAAETLGYMLARSYAPEVSQAPADQASLVALWNEIHRSPQSPEGCSMTAHLDAGD